MRVILASLVALLFVVAIPARSQSSAPSSTLAGGAVEGADASDAKANVEQEKKQARKARRDHRRAINHRQRRKH
jgi:hypothetical protein